MVNSRREAGKGRLVGLLPVRLGVFCAVVAMGVGPSFGGSPARLEKVRHWSSKAYTRVVLDLDRRVEYRVGRLKSDRSARRPARIYIDLLDTRRGEAVEGSVRLSAGPVASIRTARHDPNTSRLVLDLRQAEEYDVFRLEDPHRIVVDLWWSRRAEDEGPKGGSADRQRRMPLIVVDPGHGGRDPGAVGRGGLREKTVALSVARRLKRILEEERTARVILTRDRDRFIALRRRTAIANDLSADLFVSIHANAHPKQHVRGVETYYLDNATDQAARRLAKLENKTAEGTEADLERILIALRTNVNAWESNTLAHTVQQDLVRRLTRAKYGEVVNLGAKGNLFYVLVGAHMPSILVEVSFITNPTEEKRLRTRTYQEALARGIATGVQNYLKKAELSNLMARQ